jgi:hypothetical protein
LLPKSLLQKLWSHTQVFLRADNLWRFLLGLIFGRKILLCMIDLIYLHKKSELILYVLFFGNFSVTHYLYDGVSSILSKVKRSVIALTSGHGFSFLTGRINFAPYSFHSIYFQFFIFMCLLLPQDLHFTYITVLIRTSFTLS